MLFLASISHCLYPYQELERTIAIKTGLSAAYVTINFNDFSGPPKTQLDLKEAGSVVKPGGASGVQSPLGSSTLHNETREDVYILYEEEEREEEEEEEQGVGKEERASGETFTPNFIRRKSKIICIVLSKNKAIQLCYHTPLLALSPGSLVFLMCIEKD